MKRLSFSEHKFFLEGSVYSHAWRLIASVWGSSLCVYSIEIVSAFYIGLTGGHVGVSVFGYCSSVNFIANGFFIGLVTGYSILASREIGVRDYSRFYRVSASASILMLVLAVGLSALSAVISSEIIGKLSLSPMEKYDASIFIIFNSLSIVFSGCIFFLLAFFRALAQPGNAAKLAIAPSILCIFLDPLFIFVFKQGYFGVAVATAIAKSLVAAVCFFRLVATGTFSLGFESFQKIKNLVILSTNSIASALANALAAFFPFYLLSGDGSLITSQLTVIDKLVQFSCCFFFVMPNVLIPLMGQNIAAGEVFRVSRIIKMACASSFAYSIFLLFICVFVSFSGVLNEDSSLIIFFVKYISVVWIFSSFYFIFSGVLLSFGKVKAVALINVTRAGLGAIPFTYFGHHWFGPPGALLGQAIGFFIFTVFTFFYAKKVFLKFSRGDVDSEVEVLPISRG